MKIPNNLDEAIDILIESINSDKENKEFLQKYKDDERGFLGATHHSVGQNIRNSWYLWWSKTGAEQYESWPKEKPLIVDYFNKLGIHHADDISGIIFTSLHRKYFDQPIQLEEQIKHYQQYWQDKKVDTTKMQD